MKPYSWQHPAFCGTREQLFEDRYQLEGHQQKVG
jgi:hypothetical protein